MRGRVGVVVVVGLGAIAPAATAGVVSINVWEARLNFGLLADGGSGATPSQGPVTLSPGDHELDWQQTDGLAFASASAEYTLVLDQTATSLTFAIDLRTSAAADVGDSPAYAFERGVAESFLDVALVDLTVLQPALLVVSGATFGGFAPGSHLLGHGDYTLDLRGPLARAWVDVGSGQTAADGAELSAGFRITAVPAPATAACLLLVGARPPRRR